MALTDAWPSFPTSPVVFRVWFLQRPVDGEVRYLKLPIDGAGGAGNCNLLGLLLSIQLGAGCTAKHALCFVLFSFNVWCNFVVILLYGPFVVAVAFSFSVESFRLCFVMTVIIGAIVGRNGVSVSVSPHGNLPWQSSYESFNFRCIFNGKTLPLFHQPQDLDFSGIFYVSCDSSKILGT